VNTDTLAQLLDSVRTAVLETPGATDRAARESALSRLDADETYSPYLAKVRDGSYRVTETDIKHMADCGLSEDAILELTLAAAIGEGTRRLQAGLRALSTAED
jgi:hypothetical protein